MPSVAHLLASQTGKYHDEESPSEYDQEDLLALSVALVDSYRGGMARAIEIVSIEVAQELR